MVSNPPHRSKMMWLAAWTMRALLVVIAPVYYLCRVVVEAVESLDEWAWLKIHATQARKPPQSEIATELPQPRSTHRMLR